MRILLAANLVSVYFYQQFTRKMNSIKKVVAIVILLGTLSNVFGESQFSTCVRERLVDLLTRWREGDTLPIPLPPLGVIKLDSYEGEYSGYGIKISYATGEMNLIGVNNFTVNELEVSADDLLGAVGSIQFPSLSLTSNNYSLKGRAYVFYTLKGAGFMNITFQNITLNFKLSLGPKASATGIQVDDIRLDYSFDAVYINLEKSSWPLNKVLNVEGKNILESYHSTMIDAATEGVRSALNDNLATVTPEQIANEFTNCDCSLNVLD